MSATRRLLLASRVRPFSPREIMQQSKCSIMIERDCTTLVNPLTGDAKAFLLDRFVGFTARIGLGFFTARIGLGGF